MGVTEVGVAAEWLTAEDDRVCDSCDELNGVVLTVDEAHGLLPRHPGCRCAWVAANVGEDEEDQIRGKKNIERAFDASYRAEMPKTSKRTLAEQKAMSSWGADDKTISKARPVSVLNVFCPTGPGGGIDPTCSPGGVKAYHGSHTPGIKFFVPREIKDYNSIGSWFTSDPAKASSLYGPNVTEISIPSDTPLVEFRSDQTDFLRTLGGNAMLARKVGMLKEAKALEVHLPDEGYEKDYEKALREEASLVELKSKFPKIKEVKAANKAARSLLMHKEYTKSFRLMLEGFGKKGIVWRGSNIDTRRGDSPHDVYVLFHQSNLPTAKST